ncbi:MAG: hypothetical protein ACRCWF_03850, partial [Beijerinckiaceae bacterium]
MAMHMAWALVSGCLIVIVGMVGGGLARSQPVMTTLFCLKAYRAMRKHVQWRRKHQHHDQTHGGKRMNCSGDAKHGYHHQIATTFLTLVIQRERIKEGRCLLDYI